MVKRAGMGSHSKPGNGENELWLTPPSILYALGGFDLDPCACPEPRPWPTAALHIALPDDGLATVWSGRVWCNPPYGDKAAAWLKRMVEHCCGTALIFARTETEAWHRFVWPHAAEILFLEGRLTFYLPDGTRSAYNAGAPSALVAYGEADAHALRISGLRGALRSSTTQPFVTQTITQGDSLLCPQ